MGFFNHTESPSNPFPELLLMVASKENSRIFNLQSIEILAKNSNLQLPEFQEGEVLELSNLVYTLRIHSEEPGTDLNYFE